MSFASLGLNEALVAAVTRAGYTTPTSVQAEAIPVALTGADMMVSAATGSGKTAAFMLPALERLTKAPAAKSIGPRIMVLCPTRELAQQVAKAGVTYGRSLQRLSVVTVVGGMPYPAQLKLLRQPVDVLVATPGRLLDYIKSGRIDFSRMEMLVLDEADRMLDMGFMEDIEQIVAALPAGRQTVMFSATFGGEVGRLAASMLNKPQRIELANSTDKHADIEQRVHWADDAGHKNRILDHLLAQPDMTQAIVFTATKRDADWLTETLADKGFAAASLHGDMPQAKRNRTLTGLRRGDIKVLIATDVAARGIDVPAISHVINYGMPMKPEDYVHRIGRTGRAGRSGVAITLAVPAERFKVRAIERFTTQQIPASVIEGLEPRFKPEQRSNSRGGFGDRPNRGGGDRPRSFGDKPRSFGDRPRSFGDRPQGDRPRSFEDRPRSFSDRPRTEGAAPRSAEERPRFDDRPSFNERPRSFEDRPRSFSDRPRSNAERKMGDRPRSFADRDSQPRTFSRDAAPRQDERRSSEGRSTSSRNRYDF
ncbi:DEAD/DEAH box helicase [Uliginosibacterium sp. 31-16]|uniref:DEAD/DEAH box helicase n=1 Tax=Uliginosibacterium sp. 31-16 TaxID=3068315 RepID=UPI00273DE7F2|nr:DEAD/DEAH box helicase [Uliginosibacterium sp. 31-16]MDP5240973.1 DEAD/DEAH box helicase [Uliginosibacterium sp. 31-16]